MTTEEKQALAEGLPPDVLANLIMNSHSVHFDHTRETIAVYDLRINCEQIEGSVIVKPAITFNACDVIECKSIFHAMRRAFNDAKCFDVPPQMHKAIFASYGISATSNLRFDPS